MTEYDVIVVGLGALGSAAAFHLTRSGRRVLGLDAFGAGHTNGSSHGESRIIRMAYFEHPDYVPLLRRAYALWHDVEAEAGMELLRSTGGLFIGPPNGEIVAGSLRSARKYGLAHEVLDASTIRRRFPALQPTENEVALYEDAAGVLFPERCIEAHLRLAVAAGATLRFAEPVVRWREAAGGVRVHTAQGEYGGGAVVVTAGAWLGDMLSSLRLPLRPERNVVFWLEPSRSPEWFAPDRLPIYIWDTGEAGTFYGFPHLDRAGAKVARHHTGQFVHPDTVSRTATEVDEAPVRSFVRRCIPALDGAVSSATVCLYTNTPDGHFILDRHPDVPAAVFAGGCSGHGFKFASVLGQSLAQMAAGEPAPLEARFLVASRLGGGTGSSG